MIDALCGVAPEEDFTLPDGDVESWNVNQVAGWAASKLSARTARALRTNEVDGALLVELSKADIRTELGLPARTVLCGIQPVRQVHFFTTTTTRRAHTV